jgi:hypothetical protein
MIYGAGQYCLGSTSYLLHILRLALGWGLVSLRSRVTSRFSVSAISEHSVSVELRIAKL